MIELGEPSKDDIKCTLQADHRNGECRGCKNENSTACPKAKGKEDIKCTLQADHRNGERARLQE